MQRRSFFQLALPMLGATFAPRVASADGARLVLIVAVDSPIQDLDISVLRRLFGGDPVTDAGGRTLIPLNHPPRTPDRSLFDQRVLGMDPDQTVKYWIDRKIRAQPGPPRTVTSLRMLIGVVSKLPGAIGYVRPEYLSSEVRAIRVSGKTAEATGYPLAFLEWAAKNGPAQSVR